MPSDYDLLVKISADLADLKAKLDEGAEHVKNGSEKMKEETKSLREEFEHLGEAVKHVAEGLLVFEGIEWAKDTIKESLELGERFLNLAQITGIPTRELFQLKFAAEATGSSFDTVIRTVERSGQALNRLRTGQISGGLLGALHDLKLTPADLGDPGTLLFKVADGLKEVHSAGQRMGDLQGIFGRTGAELIPFFNRLTELSAAYKQLGIDLDPHQLDEAAQEWNKLNAIWDVTKAQLVTVLAPALQAVAKILIEASIGVDKLAKSRGAFEFGKDLAISFAEAGKSIVLSVVPALEMIKQQLGDVALLALETANPLKALWMNQMGSGMTTADKIKYLGGMTGAGAAATDPGMAKFLAGINEFEAQIHASKFTSTPEEVMGGPVVPPPEVATPQQQIANIQAETRAAAAGYEEQIALIKQRTALGISSRADELRATQQVQDQIIAREIAGLNEELKIEYLGSAEKTKISADIALLEAKRTTQGIQNATALGEAQRAEFLKTQEIQDAIDARFTPAAKAGVTARYSTGQINQVQELIAQKALAEVQYAEDVADAERKINQAKLDDQAKFIKEKIDLEAKYAAQAIKTDSDILGARQELMSRELASLADPVISAFETSITGIVQGTQTISRAFKEMFVSIALEAGKSTLKAALLGGEADTIGGSIFGQKGKGGGVAGLIGGADLFQPLQTGLKSALSGMLADAGSWGKQILHALNIIPGFSAITSALGNLFGSLARPATAALEAQKAIDLLSLQEKAAMAGAAQFSWVIQEVPFPANLAMAPGLAAAAYATTLSIGAAAFEKGGLTGSSSTFALLHPYESVLPRNITERLMRDGGGAATEGPHYNIHVEHHIHAIDAQSFEDRLDAHKDAIADAVVGAVRDGHRALTKTMNGNHAR